MQRDSKSSGAKRAVEIDLPAESLQVYRDRYTHYDLVGKLTVHPDGRMQFAYDSKYLEGPSSTAISVSMPMRPEPYSSRTASSFFDALLPEEGRRTALESMLHVDKHDPVGLLSKLNNETIGALVFETGEESPGSREDYLPVSEELFDALALHPGRVSARQNSATRLSLSGGMSKLGLYQDEVTGKWYEAVGSAPTNRIVKAGSSDYPDQILNEALCLSVVSMLDIECTGWTLLATNAGSSLLSLSRFDRVIPSQGAIYLAGKARPQRLHQEDFCQALGLQSWQKYEAATDDRHANMMVSLIAKASVNPFGERLQLLDYLTVNYLLGNCDGHLKNYSLVESLSDQTAHLSPMYDVCSTTVYPELDRRMGISISPHGLIDTVTQSSTHELVRWVGLPDAIAIPQIRNAVMGVLPAIEASRDKITHMGFPRVSKVADKILSDVRPRVDKLSTL